MGKRQKKKGWNILDGWRNLQDCADVGEFVHPITVRPFDVRHIFYEEKLVWGRSFPTMQHVINAENTGLIFPRRSMEKGTPVFLATNMIDKRGAHSWAETVGCLAPLYLYPDEKQETIGETARKPNLNADIVQTIANNIGLKFTPEKTEDADTFAPVDLLDYIYAVLHGPTYRTKFREFLKIDFPRVPYPRDAKHFRTLANLGAELRALHLMQSSKLDTLITTYPEPGDNTITAVKFDNGKVRINPAQYFGDVPQAAWDFAIGGYQPAQKYLKDRKSRALTPDEIRHYQRIIVALVETAKVMQKIGAVS